MVTCEITGKEVPGWLNAQLWEVGGEEEAEGAHRDSDMYPLFHCWMKSTTMALTGLPQHQELGRPCVAP